MLLLQSPVARLTGGLCVWGHSLAGVALHVSTGDAGRMIWWPSRQAVLAGVYRSMWLHSAAPLRRASPPACCGPANVAVPCVAVSFNSAGDNDM